MGESGDCSNELLERYLENNNIEYGSEEYYAALSMPDGELMDDDDFEDDQEYENRILGGKKAARNGYDFEKKVFKNLTEKGFYLIKTTCCANDEYRTILNKKQLKRFLTKKESKRLISWFNNDITGLPDYIVTRNKKVKYWVECKSGPNKGMTSLKEKQRLIIRFLRKRKYIVKIARPSKIEGKVCYYQR